MKKHDHPRLAVLPVFFMMIMGCATPNVQPFADATVELHRAVIQGGAITADSMAAAAKVNQQKSTKKDAAEFVGVWQDRVKLMDVLVAYSDSIANIALAGKEAQQTAQAFGASVEYLAELVPVNGIAVSQGIKLGEILVKTGIEIKSLHDLNKAVGAAHDALEEVAKYLKKDLADLKRLYVNATQDIERALDDNFAEREYYRKMLLEKRSKLRNNLTENFTDANILALKKIAELIEHMEPEHQEYMKRRADFMKERMITVQMFDKAQRGVVAWSQAHRDLKQALEQNRRPNVRLIMVTAQEIKDAVDRIQNL